MHAEPPAPGSGASQPSGRPRSWLPKVLLGLWIVAMMIGVGSLAVSHVVAMPAPDDQTRLTNAVLALRTETGRPLYAHVISASCSCTGRLFAHLVERKPFPGVEEVVVFVGDDSTKRQAAQRAGFRFVTLSADTLLATFGLESAPVLIALDATGRMTYAGGYYNHPSTIVALDESIHAELARGGAPAPLPVFGCAVSSRLQKKVDPLRIVY